MAATHSCRPRPAAPICVPGGFWVSVGAYGILNAAGIFFLEVSLNHEPCAELSGAFHVVCYLELCVVRVSMWAKHVRC